MPNHQLIGLVNKIVSPHELTHSFLTEISIVIMSRLLPSMSETHQPYTLSQLKKETLEICLVTDIGFIDPVIRYSEVISPVLLNIHKQETCNDKIDN